MYDYHNHAAESNARTDDVYHSIETVKQMEAGPS